MKMRMFSLGCLLILLAVVVLPVLAIRDPESAGAITLDNVADIVKLDSAALTASPSEWALDWGATGAIGVGMTATGAMIFNGDDLSEQPITVSLSRGARSAGFSHDGTMLATGGRDGKTFLWETATGDMIWELDGTFGSNVRVDFSPDDSLLAEGGCAIDSAICTLAEVRIWDVATGDLVMTSQGHTNWIQSMRWSPDGATLATGSLDNDVWLWDTDTGEERFILTTHTDAIFLLEFLNDGTLISGSRDGTFRFWDVNTGDEVGIIRYRGSAVWDMAISPDSTLGVGIDTDGLMTFWDLENKVEVHTIQAHNAKSPGISFNADGTKLVTASTDGTIAVWGLPADE